VTIALMFFDGCLHWPLADARLKEALRRVGSDASIERRRVETAEDALAAGFLGSPTILIDGQDHFTHDRRTPAGSLSCRVYWTPDGPVGLPTVDQVAAAFASAR
jgi:hypothetical protein